MEGLPSHIRCSAQGTTFPASSWVGQVFGMQVEVLGGRIRTTD